jgi:hypothetical protein
MSTQRSWLYASNTFFANTRYSHSKMLTLSTDTHAKLKAEESNPVIASIISVYEPVFMAYRSIYEQYDYRVGDYRGATDGFEDLLEQLPQKLREWESPIRAVYIEDSPQEVTIFPNKRTPFISGTYENRLSALGTLSQKTTADPALAGVAALISSFYNTALAARLAQQTDEGSVGEIADLRDNQRVLLANELMGVLGQLMFFHRHNLSQVERYFDMSLLRDTGDDDGEGPVTIGGNIAAGQVVNINSLVQEVDTTPATVLRLKNTSAAGISLTFYSALMPTEMPGPGPQFMVNAGQTIEVTIADLRLENYNNLNIYNNSPSGGSWQIEIGV